MEGQGVTGLQFVATGRIAGQGSKNKGAGGHFYEASKYLKPWREELVRSCRDAMTRTWDTAAPAYRVRVVFRFQRPASHYRSGRFSHLLKDDAPGRWHTQKPDLDKCERALLDSLTKAGAIPDDALVCEIRSAKVWTSQESTAFVTVEVVRE